MSLLRRARRSRVRLSRRRRPEAAGPAGEKPAKPSTNMSMCATIRLGSTRSSGITGRLPLLAECGARHAHARDPLVAASPLEQAERLMRPGIRTASRSASRRGADRPRARAVASASTARAIEAAGRYAGLGAACQRRASRRALVQISSSARHLHRRPRGAERAGGAAQRREARAQHARDRSSSSMTGSRPQPEPLAVARASMSLRSTPC